MRHPVYAYASALVTEGPRHDARLKVLCAEPRLPYHVSNTDSVGIRPLSYG
jgi:hypothetical protein